MSRGFEHERLSQKRLDSETSFLFWVFLIVFFVFFKVLFLWPYHFSQFSYTCFTKNLRVYFSTSKFSLQRSSFVHIRPVLQGLDNSFIAVLFKWIIQLNRRNNFIRDGNNVTVRLLHFTKSAIQLIFTMQMFGQNIFETLIFKMIHVFFFPPPQLHPWYNNCVVMIPLVKEAQHFISWCILFPSWRMYVL